MEGDKIIALKKTLKKWEVAFKETHEKKPTRQDIESAPQRIQDAYSEYNKLRKGGGVSNENKNAESTADKNQSEEGTADKNQSEVWGSHLNKCNTPSASKDQECDANQEKGSLLSKLSQKLYQNYSHTRKTPKRSMKATSSPEHVLQEASLTNGQLLPEDSKESDNLGSTSVFGSPSHSKHNNAAIKVTSTSQKLHNRKLDDGPACSNILMKTQDKKHALKTDWLEKCKPKVQYSRKMPPRQSDLSDNHIDDGAHNLNVSRSFEKTQQESESFVSKEKQNNEAQKYEQSIAAPANVTETSSVRSEISVVGQDARASEKDSNVVSQSFGDEQTNAQDEFRTSSDNHDEMCNSVARKGPKSKRKRSGEASTSSKRIKQSEEAARDDEKESSVPQLSSFEAFEIPDDFEDREVPGQSSQVKGQYDDNSGSEGEEQERLKQRKIKVKKVSSTRYVYMY
ncbi:uncharacterized protein [Amphiura filiformis]|uniref:uncharacterized protein n=1 Tax=Amphiura filiformis TaxID=82378 RepID=UPI003B21EC4C